MRILLVLASLAYPIMASAGEPGATVVPLDNPKQNRSPASPEPAVGSKTLDRWINALRCQSHETSDLRASCYNGAARLTALELRMQDIIASSPPQQP